jgi:hypothetical protein
LEESVAGPVGGKVEAEMLKGRMETNRFIVGDLGWRKVLLNVFDFQPMMSRKDS